MLKRRYVLTLEKRRCDGRGHWFLSVFVASLPKRENRSAFRRSKISLLSTASCAALFPSSSVEDSSIDDTGLARHPAALSPGGAPFRLRKTETLFRRSVRQESLLLRSPVRCHGLYIVRSDGWSFCSGEECEGPISSRPYLVLLFWDGVSTQSTYVILARPESESKYPGNFFNDGKTDVEGRLWVGTEGPALESGPAGRVPNRGNFYSYSTEICGLKREISNVTLSNGLAWNKNNTILYYIDSGTFKVTKLKYDRRTGVISNPETVFDFKANNIPGLLPHGMTIDTEDNLYVAMYGGYQIIKIDPTRGVVLLTMELPIALVTDMRWGGWDLDILFVTSSRMGLNETELEEQPWAGRVIAMTGLNATGCISHEAVICLPGRSDDADICSAPS
ncbi:unnamed protein product [Bemisia tabaci]|uniref:SMP-30/Gluconolactonase/LRE-like region domain-containing protein n=1 Tax=Bemisia tabaci TaxID=7038 RepID=A0A9P0F9H8_BEMTA|nr:unnamed protein product [Bemisia tabaci]